MEKLRELQRRATATRRLKDAMEAGKVHALRAALHEGAEAGVDPEDMEAGKVALALQAAQHAASPAAAASEAPATAAAATAAATAEPQGAPRVPARSDVEPSTAGEQMLQTLGRLDLSRRASACSGRCWDQI